MVRLFIALKVFYISALIITFKLNEGSYYYHNHLNDTTTGDFLHWLTLWLNTWISYGYDAGDPPYIKYPLIWITVDGEIFNRKTLP